MGSRKPVVRQINWFMVLPQLVTMAVLIGVVALVFRPEPLILSVSYGCILYLIYSYGSRGLLLKAHRQGMSLSNEGNYAAAAQQFEQSYQFLSRYPWLDRYRAFTLMSPSAISFREMALVNSAFCYSQIGDIAKTKFYYEKALAEFPNSEMAKAALRLIATAEQPGASTS